MSHFKTGVLLLIHVLIQFSTIEGAGEAAAFTCPDAGTIDQCTCFQSMKYLICRAPSKFFSFKPPLDLDTLILKSDSKLPLLTERFDPKATGITAKTLVIDATDPPPANDNIEPLLAFPSESIKILSSSTEASRLGISISKFNKDLKSITLNNVNILGKLDLTPFEKLENLELQNVHFPDPSKLTFAQSTVTRIEIIGTKNLVGSFSFNPKTCSKEKKIYIDLSNNTELENFDFVSLFEKVDKPEDCSYHIDLSGNTKIKSSFLKDQITSLNTLKVKPEQLYVLMHDLVIDCDCPLFKFYNDRRSYIHSAQCAKVGDGKTQKYLDDLNAEDFKPCAPAPNPDPNPQTQPDTHGGKN